MAGSDILDIPRAIKALGDDEELFKEVLEVYLANVEGSVTDLLNGAKEDNLQKTLTIAHTLKSSSRTIGGFAFGTLMEEIETAAKKNDRGAVNLLIARVDAAYKSLLGAMKAQGY